MDLDYVEPRTIIFAGLVVIAVAVLAVLFIFFHHQAVNAAPNTTKSTVPQNTGKCIALLGYTCDNITYSRSTGNITATVGQATGNNWSTVEVIFVPNGTAYSHGVPLVNWPNATVINGGLKTGQAAKVQMHASGPVSAGVVATGQVWVSYQTVVGANREYASIGFTTVTAS